MTCRATVLVVDDDPPVRNLVTDILGEEGYRVVSVPTEADALCALAAFRFAVVLTDALATVAPTGTDYWATLERLHAAAGATPMVICSAYPESAFDGLAERGFAGLLAKPFDLDALADLLRRVLAATHRQPPVRMETTAPFVARDEGGAVTRLPSLDTPPVAGVAPSTGEGADVL